MNTEDLYEKVNTLDRLDVEDTSAPDTLVTQIIYLINIC